MKYSKLIFTLIMFASSMFIYGQGTGNNLAFQGLINQNDISGVKARAMGNAYTAMSAGDINSMLYNPAGIAGINKFQFSASFRNRNYKTYERQQFVPVGGSFGIMELIWAGIYTPQLKDDGIRSDFIKYDLENHFTKPDSAVENYDEKFADWVDEDKFSGLNNIMLAAPFNLFDRNFVASVSFTNTPIYDFDRNERVLGTDYRRGGVIADSNWYIYNRIRDGAKSTYMVALGSEINENLDVGLSLEYMSGETDDILSKDIFAHFQIQQEQNEDRLLPTNTYYFWHDSLESRASGKSELSSFKASIGAIYKTDKVTFGLRINMPYTLAQAYDYKNNTIKKFLRDSTASPVALEGVATSGTNKFKAPFSFDFGFTLQPNDFIKIALDYKVKPFSKASYELTNDDPTLDKWAVPDMNSFHVGLELIPIEYISLLAGYSNRKIDLRKEDHFKGDLIGTKAETFSGGVSVRYEFVQFDIAYEWTNVRYADFYSFHTDYITIDSDRLFAAITLTF